MRARPPPPAFSNKRIIVNLTWLEEKTAQEYSITAIKIHREYGEEGKTKT